MSNEQWNSDEFENHVSAGIIGLYETLKPENRARNAVYGGTQSDVKIVKNAGLFFPARDRISLTDEVFLEPGFALLTMMGDETEGVISKEQIMSNTDPDKLFEGYIRHFYCQRIKRLPQELISPVSASSIYQITKVEIFSKAGILIDKNYAYIDKNKSVKPIFHRHPEYFPFPKECVQESYLSGRRLAVTINLFDDRQYTWNVLAKEKEAKVLFGVYEEQIKSLFYARDNPVKDSGRKRPILHWVSEHKRRIKNGTDINIEKYLRGSTVFEMNGTTFEILNPQKNKTTS